MSEFKGTKGGWTRYTSSIPSMDNYITHSVYTGTKRIALCYDFFESDKSKNTNDIEAQYNALLISKSPLLLKAIKDSINELREVGLNDMANYHEKLYNECVNL